MATAILVIAALIGVVDWVAAQTTIWTGGYNSQIPINYGLPDRPNGFTLCRLRYRNVRRARKSGWGDDYPNGQRDADRDTNSDCDRDTHQHGHRHPNQHPH
jgi:hypothetical protein